MKSSVIMLPSSGGLSRRLVLFVGESEPEAVPRLVVYFCQMTKEEASILDQTLSESNPDLIRVDRPDALEKFFEGRPIYSGDRIALRRFIEAHPEIQGHLAKKADEDFMEFKASGYVVYFEIYKIRWNERQWNSDTMTQILRDYPYLNEQ